MKKFFVMMAVAMMAAVSVSAQDESKHEVGVFYGVGSGSNVLSVYTGMFSASAGDQSSFWGPIGVEYFYHLSPVVAIGGVAEYAGCKVYDNKTGGKDLNEAFFTVMPSVKFNWLRKNHFGLYSGVSAGIMVMSMNCNEIAKQLDSEAKDQTLASFMFQATALGAEYGGPFRVFMEAGFGEKGVFCAGLRYKF